MRRTASMSLLLIACLGLTPGGHAQGQKDAVTLKDATFEEIGKEVQKHRGKVVVVDIWYAQ